MTEDEHYLKKELYHLVQTDPSIFDFLEAGSLDGLWYWDLKDLDHEWLSPRFNEVFGYDADEIPHTPAWWQANIHPDDLKTALANFEAHRADPSHPYDQIVRYKHKDGSTVWVRCRGLIIRDADGEPHRMLGAHTDVTPLKQSEARLRATLDAIPDPVYEVDAAGQILLPAGGGSLTSHLPADQHAPVLALLRAAIRSGEPQQHSFPHGDAMIEARLSPTPQETAVVLLRDVTDMHQARAQLEQQNQILRDRNADLDQFTYMASHDLQEPLRKITAMSELLREDIGDMGVTLSEDAQMDLDTIEDAAKRMRVLIQDLLDLSRTSRRAVLREPVDIKALITSVLSLLEDELAERAAAVRWEPLPTLRCDSAMLAQCYTNLITNALKFCPPERAPVLAFTAQEDAEGWVLGVRDNGIGMDMKYAERIFKPFQRLHSRAVYPGTGIGLAICHQIIRKHGGQIWVESQPGAGAHFRFTLPDQHEERPHPPRRG